jgi:hypothetical protein
MNGLDAYSHETRGLRFAGVSPYDTYDRSFEVEIEVWVTWGYLLLWTRIRPISVHGR